MISDLNNGLADDKTRITQSVLQFFRVGGALLLLTYIIVVGGGGVVTLVT